MSRREFIAGLGGAAAWPAVARAQQSGEMRHIGVLLMVAESDPEAQSRIKSFQQGLRQLGWSTGFWASSGCEAGHKFAQPRPYPSPQI